IVFNIGLSHPVEFTIPDDVKVMVASQTSLSVEGSDAVLVGQVAAKIRALKPAEPYKGKGFKYAGEVIRRKQGKSVAKK
ncbi:MAG: 50S ribosomal protein L6, partial [Candidatus Omnitrophica bacterium CG12_big_fil_rev_8_21_14_0_65_50_5]